MFITACSFKILMSIHLPNINELTSASFGVTEGKPHWLAYQNRLLGPYTILGISRITGISFQAAWTFFHWLTLQTFSIIFFWILRREGLLLKNALTHLVLVLSAFLILQHYWFYPWDSIDLVLFTCFAYGIIKSFSKRFFILIFIIGILNRESALFLPIYLMLDSFNFSKERFSFHLTKPKSLIIGIGILFSGIAYTKIIRHLLFVSKVNGLPDVKNELLGNHINLFWNIKQLFFYNFTNNNFYVSLFIILSFGYFLINLRKMDDRILKLLIMSLFIILNIIMFGLVNETRMHFILLPFFSFLWLCLNQKNFNSKKEYWKI